MSRRAKTPMWLAAVVALAGGCVDAGPRRRDVIELDSPVQCISFVAGPGGNVVRIGVSTDSFSDDVGERIDYALHVLPTDFDARPTGECDQLPGDPRGIAWPRVDLP